MDWDGLYLHFDSEQKTRDYMVARLSASEPTQPPVAVDRGVAPEDVLIAYYRRNTTTDVQRTWFWNAWSSIATNAWEENSLETFRSAVSLATELTPPDNAGALTEFLPRDADAYAWGDVEQYEMQENALELLDVWKLIEHGSDFWQSAFHHCVRRLPSSGTRHPPLISAYNGLGRLTLENFDELLRYAGNASGSTSALVSTILNDQRYLCKNDGECEIDLLELVENSWHRLIIGRASVGEASTQSQPIRSAIRDWLAPPWSDDVAYEKDQLQSAMFRPKENPRLVATAVM